MVVEEVGDEGEVEFGVAGDEGGRGQEFAAGWVEPVGVLEDLFGALQKVRGLKWVARADIWCELVEQDRVVFAVFNVAGEVLYPISLSAPVSFDTNIRGDHTFDAT